MLRERGAAKVSEVERLLDRARRLASDFLVPDGLPRSVWDELGPEERFYLKGLELEQAGEVRDRRLSGDGARLRRRGLPRDAGDDASANQVRLKTAAEFGRRDLKRAGTADRAEDAASIASPPASSAMPLRHPRGGGKRRPARRA